MCFYESGFRRHTNQSVGFSFICRPPEVWERVWMIHNEQAVRWTPLHCVNVSCVYDFSTASQIQSIYLLSPVLSVDWRVNQTTNQTQGWTAFNCCGHDLLKTNMPFSPLIFSWVHFTVPHLRRRLKLQPSVRHTLRLPYMKPSLDHMIKTSCNAAAKTSGLKDYIHTSHFKPFQDMKRCFSIISLLPVEHINSTGINRHALHIKYHSLIWWLTLKCVWFSPQLCNLNMLFPHFFTERGRAALSSADRGFPRSPKKHFPHRLQL